MLPLKHQALRLTKSIRCSERKMNTVMALPRPTVVEAAVDHTLKITFNNGETRLFNAVSYLAYPAFRCWQSALIRTVIPISSCKRAVSVPLMCWAAISMRWPSILAVRPRIRWPDSNGNRQKPARRCYRKVWLISIVRSAITPMRATIKSPFARSSPPPN